MTQKPSIQQYYVALKATGEVEKVSIGSYTFLFFLQASGSFQWSLDGTTFVDGYQGLDHAIGAPIPRIYLKAKGGRVNNIVFYASNFPTQYFPNTRVQSSYAKGTSYSGVTLSTDPAHPTLIPSGDQGNQRKQIVFTVTYNGGYVYILDKNYNFFCVVTEGSPLTFETDAVFYAYNQNGNPNWVLAVGELYYTN